MKTIDEILTEYNVVGMTDLLKPIIIAAQKEAIKADREHLLDNLELTQDSDYNIIVDKDSIINAPNIELL